MSKSTRHRIHLSPEVECALAHAAVERSVAVSEVIAEAVVALVLREGWLQLKTDPATGVTYVARHAPTPRVEQS
jgi:hypothetical protein